MLKKVTAAVLEEPGKIKIKEFPYPEMEKGAMIVKILMSGVCGTDKHGYKGESIQYAGTEREVNGPYPAIPGHENVGIIQEIDTAASKNYEFAGHELKPGDRVVISPDIVCGHCYWCRNNFGYTWCANMKSYGHLVSSQKPYLFGGWSEYMYVLPGSHVYKIDDDISNEIAVLSEPMSVTYGLDLAKGHSSLPNEGFMSGDTVVVLGTGPLGLCHVIKARLLGAGDIITTDKSDYRLNMSKEFGANFTFNPDTHSKEEITNRIKEITHGRGADVVVECTGLPQSLTEGIEMLRKGGTFIEVGNFVDTGEVTINPHRHLCSKNIRLIGMTNLAYTGFIPSLKLMSRNSNIFNFDKIVSHKYKIDKAEEGLKKSMALDSMKVIIEP